MKRFGEEKAFTKSKYNEFIRESLDSVMHHIINGARDATRSVLGMESSEQYHAWNKAFCKQLKDIVPLNPEDISVDNSCKIINIRRYMEVLQQRMEVLREDVYHQLEQTQPTSITWIDRNPFQNICKTLWGCNKLCPFCREPCQHSDPNHKGSHKCIQHRPIGLKGTKNNRTMTLTLATCGKNIATNNISGACTAYSMECRSKHSQETKDTTHTRITKSTCMTGTLLQMLLLKLRHTGNGLFALLKSSL